MKRMAEKDLLTWFHKKNRMPLIVRGARQVGKSTLVKLFCENNKIDLIEINFERTKLSSLTEQDFNVQQILDEIQLKTKKRITKNCILFLDEIQESPKFLKSLRYFYEEIPELAIIAAGSLLEIALKSENFSFPVGRVEFYHLGPMSFTEFLLATGNDLLAEKLETLDFSPHVHTLFKEELRKFYYVGGMPKAVKTYVEEKSLIPVRDIQNQIIQTYIADFPKYNSRIQLERIERIFSACISQLGKKIIYQRFDPNSQSRDIRRILELLIDARVILPCTHTNANSTPLAGESDQSIQKIYFLDIGLVNAMMDLDFISIDNEFKNNFNTKGVLAEQFVAQHLAYCGNNSLPPLLYYWLRDKGSQKGEIDFIFQDSGNIYPIEVKATETGHLKSLFYFIMEKKQSVAFKISLSLFSNKKVEHQIKNEKVTAQLINIPQYAIEKIYKIVSKI